MEPFGRVNRAKNRDRFLRVDWARPALRPRKTKILREKSLPPAMGQLHYNRVKSPYILNSSAGDTPNEGNQLD
jgi:hypothetical protein